MNLIRDILEKNNIEAIEAGTSISPAQNAFCAKICSKIIASQFCVVLLNNQEEKDIEVPNANVNMEYGLMLGFNKFVIPFQRKSQKLPFNVSGLDTIKYNDADFQRLAEKAIKDAIQKTKQQSSIKPFYDQLLETFVLTRETTFTDVTIPGEKTIYLIGSPLGFNLLTDFSGFKYIFLGNFTNLRTELILWRIKLLEKSLSQKLQSLPKREEFKIITREQLEPFKEIIENMEIWIIVNSDDDKSKVDGILKKSGLEYRYEIFSENDVLSEVKNIIEV